MIKANPEIRVQFRVQFFEKEVKMVRKLTNEPLNLCEQCLFTIMNKKDIAAIKINPKKVECLRCGEPKHCVEDVRFYGAMETGIHRLPEGWVLVDSTQ